MKDGVSLGFDTPHIRTFQHYDTLITPEEFGGSGRGAFIMQQNSTTLANKSLDF